MAQPSNSVSIALPDRLFITLVYKCMVLQQRGGVMSIQILVTSI